MFFAFDLDGSIDAYPREMQSIMQALRAAGHHVEVVTGTQDDSPEGSSLQEKAQYLASIGCGQCYDKLVVIDPGTGENGIAQAKADYLSSVGAHVLVDNAKANANAATAAGILVLVPWGSRQ